MSSRKINVPGDWYKEGIEYRNLIARREGFKIPIYQAIMKSQEEKNRKNRGGFVL